MNVLFAIVLLLLQQAVLSLAFSSPSFLPRNAIKTCRPTTIIKSQRTIAETTALFSTSASHQKKTEDLVETGEGEEDDFDFSALEEFSEELTHDDEDGEVDEAEMLATLDETPVGTLSVDQIAFMRDMMSFFVANEPSEEEENEEETATIVERLLFRLLDEWQAAIASEDEGEDEEDDDAMERIVSLQPTLEDFTVAMRSWERQAIKYSSSRRTAASSQEAIDRVLNLFGILKELWEEGGMEELKPNEEVMEIVLSVLSSSRERGMDRRAWSVFESIRDAEIYGFEPTTDMYQSVILSLARSRDKGSSERAENILKEAVQKFPPRMDRATNLPTGLSIEAFNKVLVSWAKSGEDEGPKRAEQLIVFMDELGDAVKPNLSSFTTLIDAYAQQNDWDGVSYSERIFNRVLDEYMEGDIDEEPNIATWTIVISAWTRLAKKGFRGTEEKADKLLKRMEALYEDGRISFGPDAIAYVACMNAWSFSKNKYGPTQAELILDDMHEKFMDGDESMKPSARSIQVVIDSWVKGGDEDTMEQAEQVLDRYEDHLESLVSSEGSEQASETIADIYRTMLFGWSKCDADKAQDYLLDMIDKNMKLDSFSFDKVIEANTQRLPEDPEAMKRIYEIFETMEKCRQAGSMQPNERVYTSFIRAMTRARVTNLASKAYKILQRMNSLYAEGNKGIRPTVFTYNAVLNACAETRYTDDAKPMEAFKIALELFNELRGKKWDGLDHVSFGNMLKCSNLLPDSPKKDKFISSTFKLCRERGLVNQFVVRDLVECAPEELWRPLTGCSQGEPNVDMFPREWTAMANSKKPVNKKKPFRRGS